MEYLIWILATAVGGVAMHFVAHEAYDKAPSLAVKLIRLASRRLPPPDNERYQEEWLAHLNDCEGGITKLLHAIDCLVSARALAKVCVQRTYSWKFSNQIESQVVELDRVTQLFVLNVLEEIASKNKESGFPKIWEQLASLRDSLAHSVSTHERPNQKQLEEFRSALGRMVETFDAYRNDAGGIELRISGDGAQVESGPATRE